uniref:Sulfotransferase domain-containing protein n=1 Tax=Grammatophora oceanica TaxID=210454 RepID=A0A7S1Y445_9STRA|mmetsp:Transcript_1822/g.2445  ORF Transcript_1822/g.2445 Transcript_1822/m.2445 type:complete len:439 (+) Transcript_1822:216-1532(+)
MHHKHNNLGRRQRQRQPIASIVQAGEVASRNHRTATFRSNKQASETPTATIKGDESIDASFATEIKDHGKKAPTTRWSYHGGDNKLSLFLWLLRQVSPGILILCCFFVYQNSRRSALVMAALKASRVVGETQPTALKATSTDRLGSKVPAALRNLADLSLPYNPTTETPYFWDIHFAGETLAESVFSKCYTLVQSCEHGLKQPGYRNEELGVFEYNGGSYVNVDTTTPDGIERAATLQLAESHLSNVVISPHLHLFTSQIFSPTSKGRFFSLFRNPIDRAISMYHYLQTASWDPMYNPLLKDMSLEEYASTSGSAENNWVTRFLVNKPGGVLREKDMVVAKEILRTKCLVGLFEEIEPSLARFQVYFGWDYHQSPMESSKCRRAVLERGDPRHDHEPLEQGSPAWNALATVNKYDMELYEYAKELFVLQGEQIFGINL